MGKRLAERQAAAKAGRWSRVMEMSRSALHKPPFEPSLGKAIPGHAEASVASIEQPNVPFSNTPPMIALPWFRSKVNGRAGVANAALLAAADRAFHDRRKEPEHGLQSVLTAAGHKVTSSDGSAGMKEAVAARRRRDPQATSSGQRRKKASQQTQHLPLLSSAT